MNKILALGLFLLPVMTHAQVLLSEIAWMGTDADANNEWIEIYNFGTTPTDLTGWTLTSADGSISVALSGTLSPRAVGVLERTDDTTLPTVTALLTYTGALANGGTTLTLKDGSGAISDQVTGGSNWESIGGSNTVPKKTPQRTRAGTWVTATPTPGNENAEVGETTITETNTNTTTETNTAPKKTTSGGGGGSSKSSVPKKDAPVTNPTLALAFDVPHTVYVNEKVNFEAEPSGVGETIMDSLSYTWNFGDTYTGAGKKTSHTFTRPGEYVVVLNGVYAKHDAMVRHDVTVLPTVFEITRASNGDLVVQNKSPEEINLGGFALGTLKEFVFPPYTFVKANGSLTIPKERTQKVRGLMSLLDTEGIVVAYEKVFLPKQIVHTGVTLPRATPQTLVSEVSPVPQKAEVKTNPDTTTQVAQLITPTNETVIQIGKETVATKEQGFIGRAFQKFASLFGF